MIWLILALILLALVLLVSYVCCRVAFYSPLGAQNDDENLPDIGADPQTREEILAHIHTLQSLPYEPVEITSYDGLRLKGRLIRAAREDAPLSLCFHGYRGTPYRDFSYGAGGYLGLGHHVLLVEERAHCTSEGHYITMGVKEREDCHAWAHAAAVAFPRSPIYLCGVSMGAATVLLASCMDLPAQVKGIIADAGYTSGAEIVKSVCRRRRLMPLYPFLCLGALLFGHFSLAQADVRAAVRRTTRPILLIHGEADPLVPCEMGRELAACHPDATLYTFPRAGHVLSYLLDEERYLRLVQEFETRCEAAAERSNPDE